jgi:ribonuclease BN (tRNA processing enzyme)
VLVHGAPFTAAEAGVAEAFGHATVDYAVALATESGARRLVLFHHSPARTDDEVDLIAAGLEGSPVPVIVARETLVVDV